MRNYVISCRTKVVDMSFHRAFEETKKSCVRIHDYIQNTPYCISIRMAHF